MAKTLADVLALRASDPRRFNAAVAEKVMGLEEETFHPCGYLYTRDPATKKIRPLLAYHSSTEADYAVLQHVRERWSVEQQRRVHCALLTILYDRWKAKFPKAPRQAVVTSGRQFGVSLASWIEPGDWATAALAVIEEGQ